mmetsp:Transcript_1241/g.2507  ORF Transcript_1241/g.2507 Transcript_1241/m.2507 type:complete len:245 (+) Transcript_1241:211-945(+)
MEGLTNFFTQEIGYGDNTKVPVWMYFAMPFVNGIVGWSTNVLAMKMTFYPLEFSGIRLCRIKNQPWGLFGWQGIVPAKAAIMSGKTCDLMTSKLFKVDEIFRRLDSTTFGVVMEEGIIVLLEKIINEAANEYAPKVWSKTPETVRAEIILKAFEQSSSYLSGLLLDMQESIDRILDLKEMCVRKCVENKALINDLFLLCGEKEFIFIERSGFYFGFLFGLVQLVVIYYINSVWVYPICGLIVGW